jgi:hypothetical protein
MMHPFKVPTSESVVRERIEQIMASTSEWVIKARMDAIGKPEFPMRLVRPRGEKARARNELRERKTTKQYESASRALRARLLAQPGQRPPRKKQHGAEE